jgi:3-methyladenine DNA glycosylase AlkD
VTGPAFDAAPAAGAVPAAGAAFDPETAAAAVLAALRPLADAERAGQARRYLKSDLQFLGVTVPGVRSAVTGTARSRPGPGRDGALAWARALWREPVHERRTAAIEVLRLFAGSLEAADLALVEAWIREAHGWAYVDPLAGDIAGPVALRHPRAWPLIDAWATDEDFWIRRSALLTLLPGIRRGQPDRGRFERYATPMLAEKEFFIRKAIGWVLRELSKKDPAYVAAWTRRHVDLMSGVTFTEAVRRLPPEQAAPLRALYLTRAAR